MNFYSRIDNQSESYCLLSIEYRYTRYAIRRYRNTQDTSLDLDYPRPLKRVAHRYFAFFTIRYYGFWNININISLWWPISYPSKLWATYQYEYEYELWLHILCEYEADLATVEPSFLVSEWQRSKYEILHGPVSFEAAVTVTDKLCVCLDVELLYNRFFAP